MTSEELIEQLAERPFRPVRIHLSNGRTHEVRHPEMAIVGEDVIALGVESDNGGLPRIRVIVYRPKIALGEILEYKLGFSASWTQNAKNSWTRSNGFVRRMPN